MNNNPMFLTLPCALTDEEVKSKANELARETRAHAALENEKKDAVGAFGFRLKTKAATIGQLAIEVDTRQELRTVACHEEPDGQMVVTVRDDTGEVVSRRMASDSEKQGRLFDLPKLAAEAAKGLTVPPGIDSLSVSVNGKTVATVAGKKAKAEKAAQP